MPTRKKTNIDKTKSLLVITVAFLSLVVLGLLAAYTEVKQAIAESKASQPNVVVELGAMEYDFTRDRAYKRTNDDSLEDLRALLVKDGQKNIELGCKKSHDVVKAFNEDRSQVLLSYGCEYPATGMFVVRENDKWKKISPTNQFDQFGIPLCSHVDDNGIDREIAPVCYTPVEGEMPQYRAR